MTPLATLAAMASHKAAAGLAVAALAAGSGSVAAAAATGSANPSVWGKTVSAAVVTCKGHPTNGTHGIGECVSKVARQKGAEERAAHSHGKNGQHHPSGPQSSHPGASSDADGAAAPNASDQPGGAPVSHPNSTNHPGGKPSGTPSR